MKLCYIFFYLISIGFNSCVEKVKLTPSPYDKLISNPSTANKGLDTNQIPILYFPESVFEFGSTKQGNIIKHEFRYYNKGKGTLFISNVGSSCGCAVAELNKKILEPGDSSILSVTFDTKDKMDFQEKEITIYGNTFPSETKIKLIGFITKK